MVELAVLAALCVVVYVVIDWRRVAPGRMTLLIGVSYVALRFPLDFLRAQDARYGALTPAQYVCLGLAIAVAIWVTISRRNRARGNGPGV